jgi:hypothetical protein
MQGMTIADAIRREGRAEGIAEGIAQGRAEGEAKAVLRLGRKKWGEPEPAVLQMIQAICDQARLERLVDAMLEAQSWADLLNVT